jgi:hypothetical protein
MAAKGDTSRETAFNLVRGLDMMEAREEVEFEDASEARAGVSDRSMDRGELCFLTLVGAVIKAGRGRVALEGTVDRFIFVPDALAN